MGGRGASSSVGKTVKFDGKTHNIPSSFEKARLADGFTRKEIPELYKDKLQMQKLMKKNAGHGPREITSQAYKQSQAKLSKDVNNWFGRGVGKSWRKK